MKTKCVKILTVLALAVGCFGNLLAEDETIDAMLQFSIDGGKTFSEDAPTIKQGGSVKVKLVYTNTETRAIHNKVIYSLLYSTDTDFASANCGKQPNRWGVPGWYQRLKIYYAGAKKPSGKFVYDLDMGERKAGTMGTSVKYDKTKKQYVAAPLPALAAFAPGSYNFIVRIYYRLKKDKATIIKNLPFTVTVK
ncbi:MAG: hypothetical protein L3J71_06485 [Victivallaceae bacterium]|nr:hypothetical protein [Victivallaceae bacterium]